MDHHGENVYNESKWLYYILTNIPQSPFFIKKKKKSRRDKQQKRVNSIPAGNEGIFLGRFRVEHRMTDSVPDDGEGLQGGRNTIERYL